jgi:hypothetical protein
VQISNVLDGLADLAAEEIAAGEDFVVPGICSISYSYTAPKAKGERWKAGDEVAGIGGVTSVKDTDSPAKKADVKLKAAPTGQVGKLKPKRKNASAFLRSKAGKNVIARKNK